ncbi:MAG: DUF4351 domain-containing protein, partial [bacterium]|nr:DUF4351 domain-containing protein [bacterium]
KEEGFREGEQKGFREGEQKGLREGEQKGLREGEQKGLREGEQKGLREGTRSLLTRQLSKKYQQSAEEFQALLQDLRAEDLIELGEYMLDCDSFDGIRQWIAQRRQANLS